MNYSSPRWQRARRLVLRRDGGRCQIEGSGCLGGADCVDHIVPPEDGGAHYDPSNLRAACHRCNTARANRSKAREGWRRSNTEVVLVVGPPASGKSTLVDEQAGSSDLVVDYDRIGEALGGVGHGSHDHEVTSAARNAVLTRIRRGDVDAPRAWIVSSNPKAESMFPHDRVEVVDPGRDEAVRRAREAGRPTKWVGLIDEWYAEREAVGGASRQW